MIIENHLNPFCILLLFTLPIHSLQLLLVLPLPSLNVCTFLSNIAN
ncbi:putative signal peptide protein [Puccinia sorghi]|uniref:Putative signal peptide protein n=1 Tax=Puccinia sorghi TaxID=27349 RepID=A0A0L6UIQ8_9BASI|nr:putative signal peptide protein [Puccinia sorghi]